MTAGDLPENVRQFLFQHIDSVEQLDTIVLLFEHKEKWWTAKMLSEELRTSVSSAGKRLSVMQHLGLAVTNEGGAFKYHPADTELHLLIENLIGQYKVRRHTILQLIFSTMKRAKSFADAFVISGSDAKEEDN